MKKVSKLLKSFSKSGQKGVAWLIDPEKEPDYKSLGWIKDSGLDLILVGGSTSGKVRLDESILRIRKISGNIPVCIFPGSHLQVSEQADAILFLSLLSGRNPEYLISHQVQAAPEIEASDLEVLPTAYLLINDGEMLSVHSASQTLPLSNEDVPFAKATALAGKYLGMRFFYLDAGSGAQSPVSKPVINSIKKAVKAPLIIGGGLNSTDRVKAAFEAGADLVVLGNSIEKEPEFLSEVLQLRSAINLSLHVN